jgi:DNA-3-methyladenine glycosylase II
MKKALTHLRRSDPVMKQIIRAVGPYKIEYSPADFSTIVRCIIYQQLSGKAALKIYLRLEAATGRAGVTPEGVLTLAPERMRELGLSGRKVDYIQDLARGCIAGEIDLHRLQNLPDHDVMRILTARKGIGPWTVHMYLIFALARPDVLPVGDLGVRVAIQRAYALDGLPTAAEMETLAQRWRPYATIASWYLWRSLGDGAGLDPIID